ncbi:MAG: hypothetical protein AB1798_17185 [Spirochaetota bacterium]
MNNADKIQLNQSDEEPIRFPEKSQEDEDTISLLDLIGVLAKRWKFIFFSTLIGAALIFGYALYTKNATPDAPFNYLINYYKPSVEVRLQEASESTFASALSQSGLGALAGLAGITAGKSTSAALAQELLKGRTLLDQIVDEFAIIERYGIIKNQRSTARDLVMKAMEVKYDSASQMLTISYQNHDPVYATNILNRIIELLEARFKGFTEERIANKKKFLEDRITQVEKEFKDAQTKLLDFQMKYGILGADMDESGNPTGGLLFSEYVAVRERFRVTSEYYDLQRKLRIPQEIYITLLQQYETTKIEEMDNSKTFQIIEYAEVPEVKAGPSRAKLCIIVTVTVFFLTIFLAFIFEYFERVKKDPVESVKLKAIKGRLGFKKKRDP